LYGCRPDVPASGCLPGATDPSRTSHRSRKRPMAEVFRMSFAVAQRARAAVLSVSRGHLARSRPRPVPTNSGQPARTRALDHAHEPRLDMSTPRPTPERGNRGAEERSARSPDRQITGRLCSRAQVLRQSQWAVIAGWAIKKESSSNCSRRRWLDADPFVRALGPDPSRRRLLLRAAHQRRFTWRPFAAAATCASATQGHRGYDLVRPDRR